jgi:hypothetical protein
MVFGQTRGPTLPRMRITMRRPHRVPGIERYSLADPGGSAPAIPGRNPGVRPDGEGELLIHYGTPLITAANTVIVPVKTGANGGFRVDAHTASNGNLVWSAPTDYPAPVAWVDAGLRPSPHAKRLYFPAAGGTIFIATTPTRPPGPRAASLSTGWRTTRQILPVSAAAFTSTRLSPPMRRGMSTLASW